MPKPASRRPEYARDYPRPPAIERSDRRISVLFAGELVADSRRTLRVLTREHAPAWFLPFEDVRTSLLVPTETRKWCEWRGQALGFSLVVRGRRSVDAAIHFPRPLPDYEELAGHVAFYPDRADCRVDGERATSQPGGYYEGWVTADVIGPFRGIPGLR